MSKEFKVPELGENVESATVARVLVSTGDTVQKEQAVVELETDKAVTEVPCDIEGTVKDIHVQEGDEVKVGQTLLTLSAEGNEEASDTTASEQDNVAPEQEDKEAAEQEEAHTSKQEPEPQRQEKKKEEEEEETQQQGSATEEEQENAEGTSSALETKTEPETSEPADPRQPENEETPVAAAPSVRRFAREIGVDIAGVRGSGPNDRISIDDVKMHARAGGASQRSEEATAALPDFSTWGDVERKPMSKVRKLTADRMMQAWSRVPHATQFGHADITDIESRRQHYQKKAENAGGHLSVTVILLKTVAAALKAFPRFNASLDAAKNQIVYKQYYNIGIAMDTKRGLVVPVIRDVDRKNIIELSVELKDTRERARNGKLNVTDMQGGNMTITNAGALGGDLFVPIVNWPEAAILGVAQSQVKAVFQGGEFMPRSTLPLALSFDHRLIDGADGVRFMRWIIEALQDPIKLVWEG